MLLSHSWEYAVASLALVAGLNWYYWPRFRNACRNNFNEFSLYERSGFQVVSGFLIVADLLALIVLGVWLWRDVIG